MTAVNVPRRKSAPRNPNYCEFCTAYYAKGEPCLCGRHDDGRNLIPATVAMFCVGVVILVVTLVALVVHFAVKGA